MFEVFHKQWLDSLRNEKKVYADNVDGEFIIDYLRWRLERERMKKMSEQE